MSEHKFTISETDLLEPEGSVGYNPINRLITTKQDADDKLFAKIVMWALERESISCNMLCDTFSIGWKRASGFLDRLHSLDIAGDTYAKLPRAILPVCVDDLSPETTEIMSKYGILEDEILAILKKKSTR